MTPDAYDLLNAALTMWGHNAMANNNATEIRKNSFGMPLHVEVDGKLIKIVDVRYSATDGIVFTTIE